MAELRDQPTLHTVAPTAETGVVIAWTCAACPAAPTVRAAILRHVAVAHPGLTDPDAVLRALDRMLAAVWDDAAAPGVTAFDQAFLARARVRWDA